MSDTEVCLQYVRTTTTLVRSLYHQTHRDLPRERRAMILQRGQRCAHTVRQLTKDDPQILTHTLQHAVYLLEDTLKDVAKEGRC